MLVATHFIQKDKDLRLPKSLKVGEIVIDLCRPFAILLLQCTFHLLTLDVCLVWLINKALFSLGPLVLSKPDHCPMYIFKSSINLFDVRSKNMQRWQSFVNRPICFSFREITSILQLMDISRWTALLSFWTCGQMKQHIWKTRDRLVNQPGYILYR